MLVPLTVAFTMLVQLCSPKANEPEMIAALFTKSCEGKIFEFFDSRKLAIFSNLE